MVKVVVPIRQCHSVPAPSRPAAPCKWWHSVKPTRPVFAAEELLSPPVGPCHPAHGGGADTGQPQRSASLERGSKARGPRQSHVFWAESAKAAQWAGSRPLSLSAPLLLLLGGLSVIPWLLRGPPSAAHVSGLGEHAPAGSHPAFLASLWAERAALHATLGISCSCSSGLTPVSLTRRCPQS